MNNSKFLPFQYFTFDQRFYYNGCFKEQIINTCFYLYRERRGNKPANPGEKQNWSGDATRKQVYGYTESSVTITVGQNEKIEKEAPKEQPVWMTQSTVDGVKNLDDMVCISYCIYF